MRYSAQMKASYSKYVWEFAATTGTETFFDVLWQWRGDNSTQIPKAWNHNFCTRRLRANAA